MASDIWSGHSTSPARPVDQQARDTLHALSSISTHSRLPFGNGALRVPLSLPFSWFHVKHAPHCVGIASAQSGLRCTVSSVILMRRCGGGAFTIQVKESSHLLHGSAPNTDARRMRSGARQTSVTRVGTRAGPSRRTHRSGTSGTSPGGGLSIPFPHTRMNPASIVVTPPAESERERSSATYGGFT